MSFLSSCRASRPNPFLPRFAPLAALLVALLLLASPGLYAQSTPLYQIDCGGPSVSPVVDAGWKGDAYASGGAKYPASGGTISHAIDLSGVSDPAPENVYQNERTGASFSYTFPDLQPTQCTVRLHFAEYEYSAAGKRTFNVSINGQTVLPAFDVYQEAQAKYKAVVVSFTAMPDSSGKITVSFTGVVKAAEIKGIEILGQPVNIALTTPDPSVQPAKGNSANKYVFDADSTPSKLTVPAWAATVSGGFNANKFVSGTSFTSFDISGATKTSTKVKASGDTLNMLSQQFTYRGLPIKNTELGNKMVTLNISSPDAPGVTTPQTASVQVFFPLRNSAGNFVSNHPDADGTYSGTTPNWYYYYSLTGANYGTHNVYDSSQPRSHTAFDSTKKQWTCYLGDQTIGTYGSIFDNANGIDAFAWTCRHEETHRVQLDALWEGKARDPNNDKDVDNVDSKGYVGDSLPDDKERQTGLDYHAKGYDPKKRATYDDNFGYGDDFSDAEDYCLNQQFKNLKWKNGTADKEDWASPGHQY